MRPCCIIDNPSILRDIVAETGAYATHEGAETVVGCLARPLDEYADKYRYWLMKPGKMTIFQMKRKKKQYRQIRLILV